MRTDYAFEKFCKGESFQLRKPKPGGDCPHFLQCLLKGCLNNRQLLIAIEFRIDHLACFVLTHDTVQPQQCKSKLLGGTIMQVRADTAQKAFVEFGGIGSGALNALMEFVVLCKQLSQLGYLMGEFDFLSPDRIVCPSDKPNQQQVNNDHDGAHYKPTAPLSRSNIIFQCIHFLIKLSHCNHLIGAAQANRAVYLQAISS